MPRVREAELRWTSWRLRTALLFSGVVVFASCGGSGVSLDDYLAEANVICADATQRMDDVIAPVFASYLPQIGEDPTDEELMGLYALFVDLEPQLRGIPKAMLSDLRSLERPVDSDDIEALWADIEQRFDDEWTLLIGASESGEAARTQLASGSPFEDLNSRAVEAGLVECVFN
jgi:hypothetical protein